MKAINGFTLIEVLVALAVGGFVVAGAVTLIAELQDASQASDRTFATMSATFASAARLEALGDMMLTADPAKHELMFEGSAQGFRAVSEPPLAFAQYGLVVWTVAAPRAGAGHDLVLVLRPGKMLADRAYAPVAAIRARRGLTHVEFAYLDGTGKLNETWPSAPIPPRAIRIRMTSAQGALEQLVLTPVATVDGRCLYDPVAETCRA